MLILEDGMGESSLEGSRMDTELVQIKMKS
jgi:hypothetical protein